MQVSFLFWNLFGRQKHNRERRAQALQDAIVEMAAHRQLDVLMFVECGLDESRLLEALNRNGAGIWHTPESYSMRFRFFTRLAAKRWTAVFNDNSDRSRVTIQRLEIGPTPGVLLAVAHLPDKRSMSNPISRFNAAHDVASYIRHYEEMQKNRRTILVGDLNMNPFEEGVVGSRALHAVMTRSLTRTVQRLSSREGNPCFYNPMWHLFGDRGPGPSGSYYFPNTDDTMSHFWNIYDQVLLRPALMDSLRELAIIDMAGGQSLLTKQGRPKRSSLSDHLPIYFTLEL